MSYFVLHEQLTFPETEIAAMLQESRHNHDQLLVHVSAYPVTAAMLNAMSPRVERKSGPRKRVRFEHGDGLTPDLIPQAKELGIVVVQNPTHLAAVRMSLSLDNDLWEGTKAQPLKVLAGGGHSRCIGFGRTDESRSEYYACLSSSGSAIRSHYTGTSSDRLHPNVGIRRVC